MKAQEKKTNLKQWFSDHKPTKRRLIQLYAALLTNANLKGFATGKIYQGNAKNVCVPGLNCYSCPAASAACPLGALQNALADSNNRAPYYIIGIILLFGLLFGRWICGFLCPFGLIQDLLHKIKTPKIKKSRFTRIASYLKYVILVVFVIILPLIYAFQDASMKLPAFCKYICPSGTLLGAGGLLSNSENNWMFEMLGPLFTWKFVLLVVFIVGAIFIYRFFCRFFCPLGALYGLFNRFSLLGMKVDKPNCTNCGLCVGQCEMDIHHVADHECISCGKCVNVCPTGAITYRGPKILLAPNETGNRTVTAKLKNIDPVDAPGTELPKKTKIARLIVAIAMFSVLAGALVYYNVMHKDPVPTTPVTPPSTEYEVGGEVGDLCYDYDLPLIGKEGTISTEDTRGKVTVINFWGTWCGPCVAELINEFPQLKTEYGDQVEVIAVHSNLAYDETATPEYVKNNFAGSEFIFCRDGANDDFCKMLGGGVAWPHTVILDQNGVIVKIIARATTFDEMKTVIDGILNKTNEPETNVGGEIGMECYDYDMPMIGKDGSISVSDTRGKVTVINFWGTWCGPCVAELINEFPQLKTEYGDQVEVIAVHSNLAYDETATPEYVKNNFAASEFIFCRDGANDDFCKMLGGGLAWPHTVILDQNGVIVEIIARATTFEEMKTVIDPLLN